MTTIIGAGFAGLSVADGLIRAGYPGHQIRIVEKYDYLGGRVVSGKRPDGTSYEIGAGRIHSSHTRILRLIRRFGLAHKLHPIDDNVFWKQAGDPGESLQTNPFSAIWKAYHSIFQTLPAHVLRNTTLQQLATKLFGRHHAEHLFVMHPYRSEIEVLRADLALESDIFRSSGYRMLEGGLHQIVHCLAEELRHKGVTFQLKTPVTNLRRVGNKYRIETTGPNDVPDADRVIVALHVSALRKLPIFRTCKLLRHVQMEPLTRIYAQMDWPWPFPRFVTDSPLRYCIPINPKTGLVMISYTDARDTKVWKGLSGRALETAVMTELQRLFPSETKVKTKPSWIHSYEWADGCSYWLPGNYDPHEVSQTMLCPLPAHKELYVCGESFSMKQAWIEGALEHAAELMSLLRTNGVYPAA